MDNLYNNFHFEFSKIPNVFNADSNPCFKCDPINNPSIVRDYIDLKI